MLQPAPGLITAYDEHACLVVDTNREEWIHLTGPQAWAWETVQATGSPSTLDDVEQGCVVSFLRYGLLVESGDDTHRFIIPAPRPERSDSSAGCKKPGHAVRAVRHTACRLSRKPLGDIIRTLEHLHSTPMPWADATSAQALYGAASRRTRWIPERLHTWRLTALTTVLAAAHAGVRVDWVLAFDHEEAEPREWCRTPECQPGFHPDCLEVSVV